MSNQKLMKTNQKGFTLIELLVVIAIIGILATMSVVALNSAREKARDSRRLSDIKNIQTALEMYYSSNNEYPSSTSVNTIGDGSSPLNDEIGNTMADIPANPEPHGDGSCPSDAEYKYVTDDNGGTTYTIMYCLGTSASLEQAGIHCATPAGISEERSGDGDSGTFCAENNYTNSFSW